MVFRSLKKLSVNFKPCKLMKTAKRMANDAGFLSAVNIKVLYAVKIKVQISHIGQTEILIII